MGTILQTILLLLCTSILTEAQTGRFVIESAVIKCSDDNTANDEIKLEKPIYLNDSYGNSFEKDIIIPRQCKSEINITIKVITSARVLQQNVEIKRLSKAGSLIEIESAIDENNRAVQLGLPIVVKIQQLPVFQVYSIKYLSTINAKATEEVYNYENTPQFQGCKASGSPLCAIQTDDSDYSPEVTVKEGFCCPCNAETTDKNGRQIRGGQLCTKGKSDNTLSELSYASVHCFRRNKHWYAVHEIGPPQIFQELFLQVFKREEKENGTTDWVQVGNTKKPISIDTWLEYEDPQLNVIYRPPEPAKLEKENQFANKRLLIPKVWISDSNKNSTPAAMLGNMSESYLIVPTDIVNAHGVDCDKAGVGYDAFMAQTGNICAKPRGTCLSNQPLDLWASDNKLGAGNSKDREFKLKHFGPYLPAPIQKIDQLMYLVFEPKKDVVAHIDIRLQVNDDYFIRPGYGAALMYVISDSTTENAKLTVQVANMGRIAGYFSVHVLQCSDELLPKKDFAEPKLILPQNITTFIIGLEVGKNLRLSKRATCTVAVVNPQNKIIALREALLFPADTCFSNLNCKGFCAKDNAINCEPIEVEKVWEAGLDPNWFGGTYKEGGVFEFLRFDEHNPSADPVVTTILLLLLMLLLFGLVKAILGKTWKRVGLAGLCHFYDKPRHLNKYYERHYSHIGVIYDSDGYPVDPFTKQRTVQRLSSMQVFLVNIVFFLILPFLLFIWIYKCCERNISIPYISRRSSRNNRSDTLKKENNDKSNPTEEANVPLLQSRSATGRSLLSVNTRTKINSLRRSDSAVEYNYRQGQDGRQEYSVNSGEWRPTPTSIYSQSDVSINRANAGRKVSGHIPSSEMDMF